MRFSSKNTAKATESLDDYELIDVPQYSQDQLDKAISNACATLAKKLQVEFHAEADESKAQNERILNSKTIDLKSQHEVKIYELTRIHDKDVTVLKSQIAALLKEQESLKKQLAASKEAHKRIENRLANEFIKN
ncbi:hypothetical protein CKAH01_08937 [Colletotrichum kahawae]|uniref:Uncharacterized protein n=1 Tax=Colletotrichum kahawae TaxID=34407 RepID=A0AAE0CZM8_COLKA|nr:hypothetical protein CKAH01_08937 [Colletotrichum kahawae]